jgi:hypothetical protein
MSDTTYEILQDGQTYKVRITRLGNFVQEADGFRPTRTLSHGSRRIGALPS